MVPFSGKMLLGFSVHSIFYYSLHNLGQFLCKADIWKNDEIHVWGAFLKLYRGSAFIDRFWMFALPEFKSKLRLNKELYNCSIFLWLLWGAVISSIAIDRHPLFRSATLGRLDRQWETDILNHNKSRSHAPLLLPYLLLLSSISRNEGLLWIFQGNGECYW